MSLRAESDFQLGGDRSYGVIFGLVIRDPQSATLTATIEGGWARVKSTTLGQKYAELAVQSTTKAFTLSKDTYVVLKTDGTFVYVEVANGAAKPTQAAIDAAAGADSLYIAKVVTDGTRVIDGGVTDMRKEAPHGEIVAYSSEQSFESTEQGPQYFTSPIAGRILRIDASVYRPLSATDNGTVQAAIGENDKYTNLTNGLVTVPLSSAVGARASATPSALNSLRAGQTLRLTSAKTTVNGKCGVTVYFEKRAA